jgi:hypothetical protein
MNEHRTRTGELTLAVAQRGFDDLLGISFRGMNLSERLGKSQVDSVVLESAFAPGAQL